MRRHLLPLALLALLSPWSSPAQKRDTEPQHEPPALSEKHAASDAKASATTSPFKQPIEPAKAKPQADGATGDTHDEASRPVDPSQWWFNFWLVGFTFCLVVVGAFQSYLVFRSLTETKKAADAAKKSADVAAQQLYGTQGAMLRLVEVRRPVEMHAQPIIRNIGRTPAYVFEHSLQAQTWYGFPEKPTYRKIRKVNPSHILAPNEDYVFAPYWIFGEETAPPKGEVPNTAISTILYGYLAYEDAFGRKFRFGFAVHRDAAAEYRAFRSSGFSYLVPIAPTVEKE
jgi:hypothetical protein